jgi:hypothetical protein
MTVWQITAGMQRLELKDGQAEVVFTVSNPGPVDDRATVDVVGGEQADASWFAVTEPQQTVPHGGTKSFQVLVKPGETAPAGTHWLAGRVYSADTAPEENSVTSDRVQFEIAAPAKPKSKLWLWILIAAGIVAVVVGVILFLVLSGDGEPPTTTPRPAAIALLDRTAEARFTSGAGELAFPGTDVDPQGFAIQFDEGVRRLHDGSTPRHIEMHPQWVDNGFINGDFALGRPIADGEHLVAKVGFREGSGVGDVEFIVSAVDGDGDVNELGRVQTSVGQPLVDVDVDLSDAAGARTLRLRVEANGTSAQDWACWAEPRVVTP